MKPTIPVSYKKGVAILEALNSEHMFQWLDGELREINHVLAGSRDDQPVQAIVDHHQYLSLEAQKRMADAIREMVCDWREAPTDWPESAARALLSLAGELRVSEVKSPLQSLVKDKKAFARVAPLEAEVLRTISTISVNDDRTFWTGLARGYPDFAGMAFQVLARIAPEDALTFLTALPQNQAAIDGIARKLPGFISQFEPMERAQVLSRISEALSSMPSKFSGQIRHTLTHAGFILPETASSGTWTFQRVYKGIMIMIGRDVLPGSVILGSHYKDRKLV